MTSQVPKTLGKKMFIVREYYPIEPLVSKPPFIKNKKTRDLTFSFDLLGSKGTTFLAVAEEKVGR